MPKIVFSGPMSLRLSSLWILSRIAVSTQIRHMFGQRMAEDWDANLEIGIRFWRHQFTRAMNCGSMNRGRLIFDSLQTLTDDVYDVETKEIAVPKGTWYLPRKRKSAATILHFHGGGYSFHGKISRRFSAMLAHRIGAPLFAPDYRLTPEHPHPTQAQDALAAWDYVTRDFPPHSVVVTGDSAGGHMALMLLQTLKVKAKDQPALCVGLCPWTDIGDRGQSLHQNDRYDLVQGWMALRFGEWLDPEGDFGRSALSPVSHDFSGLAPIYLQAGGREILRDMIIDFAEIQKANGTDVTLDIWPDMPHVFQSYDTLTRSSQEALGKLADIIDSRTKPRR